MSRKYKSRKNQNVMITKILLKCLIYKYNEMLYLYLRSWSYCQTLAALDDKSGWRQSLILMAREILKCILCTLSRYGELLQTHKYITAKSQNYKTLRIFSFAGFLLSLSYKEGGVRSVNSLSNDDFTLTCPTFSDNLLSKNLIEGKKLFPLSFLFIHVDTFVTFLSCH